ncbi:MAG: hypothetical protein DRP01_00680 [Archaeoglobales archaeon]|nr:MAG: hypothetical protein DRP01_00680 [Archaeoglobales archaeon]
MRELELEEIEAYTKIVTIDAFREIIDELVKDIIERAREMPVSRCITIARRALRDYEKELEKRGGLSSRIELDVLRSKGDEIIRTICRENIGEALRDALNEAISLDMSKTVLFDRLSDIQSEIKSIVRSYLRREYR